MSPSAYHANHELTIPYLASLSSPSSSSSSLLSSSLMRHKPQNHTFAVLFLLAVCGWTCEVADEKGAQSEKTDRAVSCEYCCRRIIIAAVDPVAGDDLTRPGVEPGDDGPHPAKRRKVATMSPEAGSSLPSPASPPAKNTVRPQTAASPLQLLAARSQFSPTGTPDNRNSRKYPSSIDPVSSHRHFCPFVNSIWGTCCLCLLPWEIFFNFIFIFSRATHTGGERFRWGNWMESLL